MANKKARKNFFNKVSVKLIDSNSKQPNQPGPFCESSDYEARARSSRKRVKRFSFSNPSSTSKKALKTNSAKKDPTDSDSDWSDDNNKSELTNNLLKSKVQIVLSQFVILWWVNVKSSDCQWSVCQLMVGQKSVYLKKKSKESRLSVN